jgi:hypothetical protein
MFVVNYYHHHYYYNNNSNNNNKQTKPQKKNVLKKSEYRYNLHIALFFFYSHYFFPPLTSTYAQTKLLCHREAMKGGYTVKERWELGNVMHKKNKNK